jgi:hypothetical protein
VRLKKMKINSYLKCGTKNGEKLISEGRHKKVEKNSYLKCETKKWRTIHTLSEAQKSEEKIKPQVWHKK